jgi:hypothetical protein
MANQRRSDAEALACELQAAGYIVIRTTNHYRVPIDGGGIVHFASTPSDWRWRRNTEARIRRMGSDAVAPRYRKLTQ